MMRKRLVAQAVHVGRNASQRRVDELLQRRFRFVGDALREIGERGVARAHDGAAERRVDAGKQAQERRFSRAIRPDEPHALAVL